MTFWARAVLLLTLFSALIHGPRAIAHDDDGAPHTHARPQASLPKGLVLPAIDGPKPWSEKPLFNDPERFQIAIMTDRTGGHRPGIWQKGVGVVNLLRPEFVMSVGDLIEGYSEDPEEIETQWKEFLGFIDAMKMKFFFVAGNHDLSNPVMHKHWRDHFGKEWYSFDYKGVHFVALNSEDPHDTIGSEQLAWLTEDLDRHKEARWTLLFLHKPLWLSAEREVAAGNQDSTNWKQVEKLLANRNHTVFAGHVHHYVQYDRNGQKYFHLATTGGGTQLRGVPYGEFDHVMWLTMEADGPHTAIVMLDGVLAPETVNEQGIARFRDFLSKAVVEVAPILIDDDSGFTSGRIDIRLRNGFDVPVTVQGAISGLPLRGLSVDPESIRLKAGPKETTELALNVEFGEKIAFPQLARTTLTAKIVADEKPSPLSAEKTVPVLIDRGFDCPTIATPITIDGDLGEWPKLGLTTGPKPLVLGPEGRWQGPDDGSVDFAVVQDENNLYIGAAVRDDKRIAKGDALDFYFDPRSPGARQGDSRLRNGTYRFHFDAPNDEETKVRVTPLGRGRPLADVVGVARKTENGYTAELTIPKTILKANQSDDWHSFQLGIAVHDADQDGDEPNHILWRGSVEYDSSNQNFGHFRNK